LLAGRKLLLADDSITIQKVVELTFADEGVGVVCVNNGREAIERLEELMPDVVLADVFMPQASGYEVCEYIKQNDKLKHIPVMLLVGSFEPFDEEEARRVGADETLTKPFQSIRRLIDKVGQLVGNRPPEELIPTAELPKPDVTPEPEEKLSTAELEITTADTKPLPDEMRHVVEQAAASQAKEQAKKEEMQLVSDAKVNGTMESELNQNRTQVSQGYEGAGEVLLDLGDFTPGRSVADDDFVLDIDLDEIPEPSPVEPAFAASAFRSRDSYRSSVATLPASLGGNLSATTVTSEPPAARSDQLATTQAFERIVDEPVEAAAAVSAEAQVVAAPAEASLPQLSPEMIDAIARRAVEQLSEKVVQEIAWEVVPQLAELLIKRQLEEKSS
jgi:CheY-like chemotaxis protein/molybdopterin-biosynthesis enzyme MoeA-like protein